jgi:hypothetical protein
VDFLDIEKRTIANAEKAVEKADRKTRLLGLWVPVIAGIATAVVAYFFGINNVKERVAKLEGSLPTSSRLDGFGERISKVEALVPALNRLDTLELKTIPTFEARVAELEAKGKKDSKAR